MLTNNCRYFLERLIEKRGKSERVRAITAQNLHLMQYWFLGLQEAQRIIEKWREDYNFSRPHIALQGRTSREMASHFLCLPENDAL